MYESISKFRYTIRWFIRGAAFLALIAAIFAAALPLLVEARAVRAALVQNLSSWSGGPVKIRGQLRIKSFTSLSIEADGVSFASTPRLGPVSSIETGAVTAILKIPAVLRGRIEFNKISIESPRVVAGELAPPDAVEPTGLELLRTAAAFANLSVFERLELRHCAILASQDARRPYWRWDIEKISLSRNAATAAVSLQVHSKGLDASFNGNFEPGEQAVSGAVRIEVQPDHPAAARIASIIAPWEKGNGISAAGDLALSKNRVSLDGATIKFGSRTAKGSLTFATRHGRPLTEGTLAYDTLEWAPAGEAGAAPVLGGIEKLEALFPASGDTGLKPDFDMRISAEHFRAGAYDAGPLALALTSQSGRVSADIAELSIFGGSIAGRVDFDAGHPTQIMLSANGSRLDSEALAAAMALPIAVTGPVSLRLALEIPLGGNAASVGVKNATGSFGITFPAGGTLDGDVSKSLSAAFAPGQPPQGLDAGTFQFTGASIEGAAGPAAVTLKLDSEIDGSRIAGLLRIAMPGGQVDGTLTVSSGREEVQASAATSPFVASIGLSGTAAALHFSAANRPALAN